MDSTLSGQKKRSLKTLQEAALPHLDWRDILKVEGEGLSEADVAAMTEYFSHFLKPGGGCVKCSAQQGGDILDAFIGKAKFTWGLTNGEGFCSDCKYPARAYHREVGPIKFLNMILQYHPDELSEKASSVSDCGSSPAISVSSQDFDSPTEEKS